MDDEHEVTRTAAAVRGRSVVNAIASEPLEEPAADLNEVEQDRRQRLEPPQRVDGDGSQCVDELMKATLEPVGERGGFLTE